ncbi:hypothetical protein SAMN02745163_02237 [Clostridium cavendishii DSM 21758]|uniref:Uncharacterized protein n=1 Tax=Clostridium cavendishii DSM 21758 TaxID=1121302 RepID=A0A1M6KMB1_9CLOT|nr:hypothetical protein [Clostridium cavendishii]SHJ60036.1 hypothetical protein SAMN02745163_02237 [Clostridium cavendishii DSM 21758]
MKRNGSILIEPLIYMFIASLIMILCFNMLSIYIKEFKAEKFKSKVNKALETADITIKSRINVPYITNVCVNNNRLFIEHDDIQKKIKYKDEIYLDKNSSIIKINYYEGTNLNSINNILEDVESIELKEKGSIIYMKIRLKEEVEKILVYEKG